MKDLKLSKICLKDILKKEACIFKLILEELKLIETLSYIQRTMVI